MLGNNKIKVTILIALTLMTTCFGTLMASNAAEEMHEQFANGQSSAIAYIDNMNQAHDVIAELISIDTESPYDAEMIISRGTSVKLTKYKSSKIKIELEQINPINISEADKLLDSMEKEIRANLSDNATDKETLRQIIRYISKTYSYDFLARTDSGDNNNFVDAYNSDRKIICTQYSALTYLLCNRFGIDCKIVSGNDHRYNAIRLDGEDTYTAYDLTKTTFYMPAKVGFVDLITGNYTLAFERNALSKAIGKALNSRISFHYSVTIEEVAIVGIIVLVVFLVGKKNHKRGYSAKRR